MGRLPRLSRRAQLVVMVAIVAVAVLLVVADLPTTSQVMVNFVPQTVTQPLYAKAIAFVDRDIQMRLLAERVVGDARDPEDKAERILRWTSANVRPVPAGVPVVDDHPYSTIVRGYGDPDQAADVFANLAAYSGIPADLVFSRAPDGSMLYAFAIVAIGGADRLFDVREGRVFRDPHGGLASLDDLRNDPSLVEGLPAPAAARGIPYSALIERLEGGPHRRPSDQMPLLRLVAGIQRLLRH